jgi:hypothetical protein
MVNMPQIINGFQNTCNVCVPGQVFPIDPSKIFPQVQCTQTYMAQNKTIWFHGNWTARKRNIW